jgi:ribose transport system permease protein
MTSPEASITKKSEEPEGARPRQAGGLAINARRFALGQRLALPVVWIIVIAVFGALKPGTFLTSANFANIFGSQAVLVILALALIVPLTAGDYDLSVAATLTFAAMLIAVLNVNDGWDIVPAILVALAAGMLIGAVNGFFVITLGVDSLIATLGTGTFVQGLVLWISGSNTISGVSNHLVSAVLLTKVFGIPIEFFYDIAVCAILWYFFEFTAVGRRLLFVGRGRDVARLTGLRVGRLRWGALMASGFLGALAGTLYVGTGGGADPTSGLEFLLPAFAAAFLGGTTIMPGRFNPWGTVIAAYFLITGITGLQLLGVASFIQQLFYGAALVIAVALSEAARRRRERAAT